MENCSIGGKLYCFISYIKTVYYEEHMISILPGTPYCNRTMDMWGGCWPDTLPGRVAKVQCPDVVPFDRNGKHGLIFLLCKLFLVQTKGTFLDVCVISE